MKVYAPLPSPNEKRGPRDDSIHQNPSILQLAYTFMQNAVNKQNILLALGSYKRVILSCPIEATVNPLK